MGVPPLATRHSEIAEATPVAEDGAAARHALIRLCAAAFVAYCSYAICRTPLLPLRAGRRWVIVTGLVVCSAAVWLISIATNASAVVTAYGGRCGTMAVAFAVASRLGGTSRVAPDA